MITSDYVPSPLLWISLSIYMVTMVSASIFDLKKRQVPDIHWWISSLIALTLMGFAQYRSSGLWGALLIIPMFALLSVLLVGYPSAEDLRRGNPLDWAFLLLYILSAIIVLKDLMSYRSTYQPAFVALLLEGLYLALFFIPAGGIYLLHGGADVKALQVLSILLPTYSCMKSLPLLTNFGIPHPLLVIFPPSFSTLINAALLSLLASIIYFSAVNIKDGGAPLRFFFTSRRLELEEAKRGHWWVYVEREGRLVKEDSQEVTENGTYWATPKTPFIVFLTAGFLLTLLGGNLLMPLIYYLIIALTG